PFIINGTTEWTANTYSDGVITTLTDATGCPGVLCGKKDEASGLLDCCAYGTTNCGGTCKENGNHTTNDGVCTGTCNTAYVQLRDQCGNVLNAQYGTRTSTACVSGCVALKGNCSKSNWLLGGNIDESHCARFCGAMGNKYYTYWTDNYEQIGRYCNCCD
ncbi:MAG: hypothetical protein LBF81_04240, partial [Prevotellaceae bacterium]|nr:hypothetical protein [Prevotellaceae bacterium]